MARDGKKIAGSSGWQKDDTEQKTIAKQRLDKTREAKEAKPVYHPKRGPAPHVAGRSGVKIKHPVANGGNGNLFGRY